MLATFQLLHSHMQLVTAVFGIASREHFHHYGKFHYTVLLWTVSCLKHRSGRGHLHAYAKHKPSSRGKMPKGMFTVIIQTLSPCCENTFDLFPQNHQ